MGEPKNLSPDIMAAICKLGLELAADQAAMETRCYQICAVLECSEADAAGIYLDLCNLVNEHVAGRDRADQAAVLDQAWKVWTGHVFDARRSEPDGLHAVEHWLRTSVPKA